MNFEDLELSTQVLIAACEKRKISFEILNRKENLLRIHFKHKSMIVKQATITEKDSYLCYHLMGSKIATKLLLSEAGFQVPRGGTFIKREEALSDGLYLEKRVVVKPNTTNYGEGIFIVEKGAKEDFQSAVEKAFECDDEVLIEEFVKGKEFRFLIIDGAVIAITHRDPANVVGNGALTIEELIQTKNSAFKRGKEKIQLGEVETSFLKKQNLSKSSVPKRGEKIYLRKNSNLSTGGDPIDVTDEIPTSLKEIAVKATETLSAKICGVDMIISSENQESYSILELNYNPMISMHAFPYSGKARDVGGALVEFLERDQ